MLPRAGSRAFGGEGEKGVEDYDSHTLTSDTRVRSRVILVPAYRVSTSAGHTVTFRNERMHRVAPICPASAN